MPKKKWRRWDELAERHFSSEELREDAALAKLASAEVGLKELRKSLEKTQAECADRGNITQSEVSRIEGRSDHQISTLRRYMRALDCELEIFAVFGNRRLKIKLGP